MQGVGTDVLSQTGVVFIIFFDHVKVLCGAVVVRFALGNPEFIPLSKVKNDPQKRPFELQSGTRLRPEHSSFAYSAHRK